MLKALLDFAKPYEKIPMFLQIALSLDLIFWTQSILHLFLAICVAYGLTDVTQFISAQREKINILLI